MTGKVSEDRLDRIYSIYNEERGFERMLVDYKIRSILPYLKGKQLLDIGCGVGLLCQTFASYYEKVVGIDGSAKKIVRARKLNAWPNISFIKTMFMDYVPDIHFDTIIASNVLEHMDDGIGFLEKSKGMLSEKGRIIVTVPNALGLHKRIGKHLGIIKDFYELTADDLEKGHCRIYDKQRLINEFLEASLQIIAIEGILLKPLSSSQMESWDIRICDALYKIGKELPEYCSSLMVVSQKRQNQT